MQRYFLTLSYNGTAYNGWQMQPNAPTVQETLQRAMSALLKQAVGVVGAGRTDTGVHAARYVAHFDAAEPIANEKDFLFHLNCMLPDDIAVSRVRRVKPHANARFDAVSREYKYYITTEKDPFAADRAWKVTVPLDVEAMNRAAALLPETSDFTSFCRLHSDNKTNICKVFSAGWERAGNKLVFTVRADRFLRNMVRALVGTMVDVGRGKITVGGFAAIIEARDRGAASGSAYPQGLFLTDVEYRDEVFL